MDTSYGFLVSLNYHPTPFSVEGNAVVQNLVSPVIHQVFCIPAIPDLRNRLFTGFLQTGYFPCIFQLEDNSGIGIFRFDNNIREAFSGFHVRSYQPVGISGEQSNQKSMIGAFLFFLRRFCIEHADGIAQRSVQIFLDRFGISFSVFFRTGGVG